MTEIWGDDARGLDVVVERLGDVVQGHGAVLDAGAGAFVQTDDRAAGLDGELLQLHHLLSVHLAEGAAEDRAVLREDAHLAAVDGAPAGDDAVGGRALGVHAEVAGAVTGQCVGLDEGALVEEVGDAIAGGHAPLVADLLERGGADGHGRLGAAAQQVLVLRRGGLRRTVVAELVGGLGHGRGDGIRISVEQT